MATKRKEESIETLRGIAIILMVAGHVIGLKHSGLKVADDSLWRYFYYSFEYLRMPLFTAISGYVYAIKPLQNEYVTKFFKGKSRRILLPFFSVATVQYVFNAIIPYVNSPTDLSKIWRIYIYGYGQFWFLQALFLVFVAIILLEYNNITRTLKGWVSTMFASIAVLLFVVPYVDMPIFNFGTSLYLLPFFLLGIGIKRFRDEIYKKPVLISIISLLVVGLTVQQLNWFDVISIPDKKYGFLGVFVGLTGIYMIFRVRGKNKALGDLGYYAYGIYLFHVFGTAGSRIVSKALGIESTMLLFLIGLLFGLGFPIILEKYILLPVRILRKIFLGLR